MRWCIPCATLANMGEDYYPDPDFDYDDWEPDEDWLANDAIDSFTDHVERTLRDLRAHPRADEVLDLLDQARNRYDDARAIFVDGVGSHFFKARDALHAAEVLLLEASRRIDRRQPPSPWHGGLVEITKLDPPCPACGGQLGWIENVDGPLVLYCNDCAEPLPSPGGRELQEVADTSGILAGLAQQPLFEVPADPSQPSRTSRRAIPVRLRTEVLMRANFRCEWCQSSSAGLQIGHILSVRDGHRLGVPPHVLNSFDNLMVQCEDCNQGLGGESMPTWIVARILQARATKGQRPPNPG